MSERVACPECGGVVEADLRDRMSGQRLVECPACETYFNLFMDGQPVE